MTDEHINERIAEALNADEHWMIQKNYCTDLNAMHEAEKMPMGSLQSAYIYELWSVTGSKNLGAFENINASARQRAEAFLRTLGKWEEGE